MSYCVNCGVELDASAKTCALCNTPVINPNELSQKGHKTPFPQEKGQVETVKRKDMGILMTTVVLTTALTCGLLNIFVFPGAMWSLAVIGVCAILWVIMIPAVIYTKQSVYVSLLYDGISVAVYLYMLAYMIGMDNWFWQLGLPIVVWITILAELLTFCIRKLPRSFLTVSLYIFTTIALLCVGLEILIDRYIGAGIHIGWSAVVLTICAIVDIAIITMLSRRRLRNAVRRRLHF
ncbi:MAG: hypothetical protein E7291_00480 [Lachnospiraceae bacterium]|nr:hypothetical protein [Lachnospiraceae bacterium]